MNRICKLVLAMLVLVGLISVTFNAQAEPTSKKFKSYDVTQTWYKDGGTLVNPWPQSTTAIECGGISQVDTYTIDTASLDYQYKALINGGVLTGPAEDAKFHPHNYKVSVLPECLTVIPVPAELVPAPPTCQAWGLLDIPANTESIKWTVNGEKVNNGEGYEELPGTYVVVYHTTFGYILANGKTSGTQTITVLDKLNKDSEACYVKPVQPPDEVTVVTGDYTGPVPTCENPTVTWTQIVTETRYVYIFVEDDQAWEVPVTPTITQLPGKTKTVSYSGPTCAPNTICPSDLIYKNGTCVDQNVPAPSASPSVKPVVKVQTKPKPAVAVVSVVPVADTSALANTGSNWEIGLKWALTLILIGCVVMIGANVKRYRRKN